MSRRTTTIALAIALVVTGWVGAAPAGATTIQVANEAQYRAALTTLSGSTSGPNTITVSASFTLSGSTLPTYTGDQALILAGGGRTISGGGVLPILVVTEAAQVTLRDVVLRDGIAGRGGAVAAPGRVTLERVTLRDNQADEGGAIHADDIVATDLVATGNASIGFGGVLYASDDLAIHRGWITSNQGQGVLSGPGTTIDGLYATGNRGGAVVDSPAGSGGAVITDSSFVDNAGAAVSFDISGVEIRDSHFERNVGGGVTSGDGPLTVLRSTFVRNGGSSYFGGAFGTDVVVEDSSFIRNSATGAGGGVYAAGDGLTATNTTFIGNRAPEGAAIAADVASLHFVTVDANVSTGSSVFADLLRARGTAMGATEGGGVTCDLSQGATSQGGNVDGGTGCGFDSASDRSGADELYLGAPRDNGGGVLTAIPMGNSLLVDQVPARLCRPGADARGVVRPFGPACDAGAVEQVFPAHGYHDVPRWAEAAVRWVASPVNHPVVLAGGTGGRFRPNAVMSRGAAVQMIYDASGAPGRFSAGPCSTPADATTNNDAICWASAKGIVTGFGDGTFRPSQPLTRAQFVTMLYRLAGSVQPPELPDPGFVDVRPGAHDAVGWAWVNGLATGYPNHRFRPNESVTRAQAAKILWELALAPLAWNDPANGFPAALFVED